MAVVKRRTAVKRLRYSSFGRHTVTFKIGNIERTFTLPEDLICRSSAVFRKLLQQNRKTVGGECSICHDILDADEDEITFCRARCGQNLHERCMDKWKATERGTTKCPMCRQVWRSGSNGTVEVFADDEWIEKDAMRTYCDWLYTGTIHIDKSVPRDSEDFGLCILNAHTLATHLDDTDFRNAVVANFIAEIRFAKRFWLVAVKYVFEGLEDKDKEDEEDEEDDSDADVDDDTDAPGYEIDTFVIDNFIEVMDSRFFQRHTSTFPKSFIRALSQRLLEKTLRPSQKDILEEYADGEYEISE